MSEKPANPRLDRVLAAASSLADDLGHDFIGLEHVLAALVDEGRSAAAQILGRHTSLPDLQADLHALLRSSLFSPPGTTG